jgi:hypothetical protein
LLLADPASRRAGIAGINKTIAIASITQTQDITYAIYKLNTWVLTEMWFIIVFGSIPVLRPLFRRFTQDLKTVTGKSRDLTNPSTHLSTRRNANDSWMQLDDRRSHAWVAHEYRSQRGESEEEILTGPSQDQIIVTKDMIVTEHRTCAGTVIA